MKFFRTRLSLTFAMLIVSGSAFASEAALWAVDPMTDLELAERRGGFTFDQMEIAIGLEQVVSVDGTTLVVNRLSVPNLNQRITGRGLAYSFDRILTTHDRDLGGGQAVIYSTVSAGNWATVIQNNLNDIAIQNIRQLNIELNNLGSAYRVPREFSAPAIPFIGR